MDFMTPQDRVSALVNLTEAERKLTENFDQISGLLKVEPRDPANLEKFNQLSFFAASHYRDEMNCVQENDFKNSVRCALTALGFAPDDPYAVGKLLAERSALLDELKKFQS